MCSLFFFLCVCVYACMCVCVCVCDMYLAYSINLSGITNNVFALLKNVFFSGGLESVTSLDKEVHEFDFE